MKTFATPTLFDEMELPSELDFLLEYDHQPNFSVEPQLMAPESYLLQDFNLVNAFVPLSELLDCETKGSVELSHIDKSSTSDSRVELDEPLFFAQRQDEGMLPVVETVDAIDSELVKTEPILTEQEQIEGVVCAQDEDVAVSNDEIVERHNKVRRKRFNCSICKYHAQQPDALKIHMKTFHSESKPFKCNQCDFVTVERSDFMSHLISHHKQERYNCDQCDYGANRVFLMKLHMMTHNGEIPFKCGECDYSTLYKKKLKEHMWLHSNDRPFKCTQCNYVGLNSKSLSYHVAKKHKLK